jgi:hypothetical protein
MVCFTCPYLDAFVFSFPIKIPTINVVILIKTFQIGICLAMALWKMLLPYGRENAKISSIVTKLCKNINLLRKFKKITRSFREHPFFSLSSRLSVPQFFGTNCAPLPCPIKFFAKTRQKFQSFYVIHFHIAKLNFIPITQEFAY